MPTWLAPKSRVFVPTIMFLPACRQKNRCALIPTNKSIVENTAGTSRIGTPDAVMPRRIAVAGHPENWGAHRGTGCNEEACAMNIRENRVHGTGMNQRDAFNGVLASLHEAVFDDACWPAASALIDEACRIKGNMQVHGAGSSHDDVVIYRARLCYRGQRNEEFERRYFEEYHARDERVPRIRALPDSRLVHGLCCKVRRRGGELSV